MAVRRRLKDVNLKSCLARRKPQINKVHKRKRLAFAKKYVNKPLSFWKKIIRSKFELLNKKKADTSVEKTDWSSKKAVFVTYCEIWREIYNGMEVFFLGMELKI